MESQLTNTYLHQEMFSKKRHIAARQHRKQLLSVDYPSLLTAPNIAKITSSPSQGGVGPRSQGPPPKTWNGLSKTHAL